MGFVARVQTPHVTAGGENLSPFSERVATYREDTTWVDVGDIHVSVRQSILDQIHAVQQHRRSQIVLLAGRAGAGKPHSPPLFCAS